MKAKKKNESVFFVLSCLTIVLVILTFLFFLLDYYQSTKQKASLSLESEAQKIVAACQKLTYREECYAEQFGKLTQKTSASFAKETLPQVQQLDPKNTLGCHLIAHGIAIAQVQKEPSRWKEFLENQDYYSCTGGYLHGILEAHSRIDPSFQLTPEKFSEICSDLKDKDIGERSCNHNLGHILLAEKSAEIQKAVDVCIQVPNYNASFECLSGTFMENLTRLNLITHGLAQRLPWNAENTALVEKLCQHYRGIVATACWKEISYMYAALYNTEPKDVFAACKRAPEKIMQDQCYIYGAGNMVVFSTFNPEKLNEVCLVYDQKDPLYRMCMMQIVGSQLASSPELMPRVIELCSNALASIKTDCFSTIGRGLIKVVNNHQDREKYCQEVPSDYKSLCTGSAT